MLMKKQSNNVYGHLNDIKGTKIVLELSSGDLACRLLVERLGLVVKLSITKLRRNASSLRVCYTRLATKIAHLYYFGAMLSMTMLIQTAMDFVFVRVHLQHFQNRNSGIQIYGQQMTRMQSMPFRITEGPQPLFFGSCKHNIESDY